MPTYSSNSTTKRTSTTNKPDRNDCARGRIDHRDEKHGRRVSGSTERGRLNSEAKFRRKGLGTAAPHRVSDSESDLDCISTCTDMSSSSDGNKPLNLLRKQTVQRRRPGLRRSLSQKELKTCDECSSQSSVLTDEDGVDSVSIKKETVGTVHTKEKDRTLFEKDVEDGLFDSMSKELLQAVIEMRLDHPRAMHESEDSALANRNCIQPSNYIMHQAFPTNGENHMTEINQLTKHNPNLLAEMMLQRHDEELSQTLTSLLSDSMIAEKTSGGRKADDRNILTEEADRIIEDFILNVEDTDILLIDGERSDASSSLRTYHGPTPTLLNSLPADIDGVVLPWLQWETCDDASVSCHRNKEPSLNTGNITGDARQDHISAKDTRICGTSSGGSWSPVVDFSSNIGKARVNKSTETTSVIQSSLGVSSRTRIDMEKYLTLSSDEDFLSERWRQKQMISTGAFLLCNNKYF